MTCIAAIGIDDEQNIATHLSDRLHPNFAVVATDILLLQRGPQEHSRRVIEAEPSFAQRTLALRFVPLKEHSLARIRFKRTSVKRVRAFTKSACIET
jgi:hypothetical protein